jgi:hypothetical protein
VIHALTISITSVKTMKLILQFSPLSYHFLHLRSKYFLSIWFPALSIVYTLFLTWESLTPIDATDKGHGRRRTKKNHEEQNAQITSLGHVFVCVCQHRLSPIGQSTVQVSPDYLLNGASQWSRTIFGDSLGFHSVFRVPRIHFCNGWFSITTK